MNSENQQTPIAVQPVSPDSVADARVDAIIQRFSWFANPDHQWSPSSEDIQYPSQNTPIVHTPSMYHLRRRPNIQCPACLRGDLGQLAHMEGPHGCLYDSDTEMLVQLTRGQSTLDNFYNVENE